MTDLRIAIIGDKSFNDYPGMKSVLDTFVDIHAEETISIISSDSKGASSLAKKYALDSDIEFKCYPADRESFGAIAGLIRDKGMIGESDRVIAFYSGKPGETKNALEEADRAEIPNYVVGS